MCYDYEPQDSQGNSFAELNLGQPFEVEMQNLHRDNSQMVKPMTKLREWNSEFVAETAKNSWNLVDDFILLCDHSFVGLSWMHLLAYSL